MSGCGSVYSQALGLLEPVSYNAATQFIYFMVKFSIEKIGKIKLFISLAILPFPLR